MLKIFSKETTSFFNNGIGVLTDYISDPIITEVLNGEYTLELEYLKTGKYADYLVQENIIKANGQLFRISSIDKNLKTIKVLAKHIAFDLSKNFLIDVAPTDKTGQAALEWILERTEGTHNFTAYSDIATVESARYVRKNVMEAIASADNSILKVWGGELEFDNYNIKLLQQRGLNRGLSIRYGKNLTGVEYKLDFSSVATKIMPQGNNELLLPEQFIESPLISSYAFPIFKKVELDIGVDEETTEEQAYELMRAAVQKLFDSGLDKPAISVKVDFLELSKVEEYSNYSNLEAAYLGDTIKFIIPDLNLNFETRIVKTEYNCVKQRFEKLELGSIVPDFINQNSKQISELKEIVNKVDPASILSEAQANATSLITQAMGGYIYKTQNELFIMDDPDPNVAQKIWRWNLNGLAYSSTGVNGTYEIAMTNDGKIVADFITTGSLAVARISGLQEIINGISAQIDINDTNIQFLIPQVNGIIENGTAKLINTLVEINDNGIGISKEGEEMSLILGYLADNKMGLQVNRNNEAVLSVTNTGVEAENVTVRKYLIIGNNSRMENYQDGTGVFFIGDEV